MSDKQSHKSSRGVSVRVKTAKKRTTSSTRWLMRQLNDPYVQKAKREGYRSRAAFKLLELDDKFHFLGKGKRVVDLGAAPGGWSQVAIARCGSGHVVGIDIINVPAIAGATLLHMDFMEESAPAALKAIMGQPDIVLSDMAPNASGQQRLDHLRIITLAEAAFEFACNVLKPGGTFVCKVWQGGAEKDLLVRMKTRFTTVRHAKPNASRQDSAETFVVAMGFK